MNKLSHKEIIQYGIKWLKSPYKNASKNGHGKCSIIISELVTRSEEIPDIIGFYENRTILIEAKTSLSDFLIDQNKIFRRYPYQGMGNFRYYICQNNLISLEKLPDKWGLLQINKNKIKVIKEAEWQESNKQNEIFMLLSLFRRIKNEKNVSKYLF